MIGTALIVAYLAGAAIFGVTAYRLAWRRPDTIQQYVAVGLLWPAIIAAALLAWAIGQTVNRKRKP